MKFAPVRAAAIFAVGAFAPAIPFVVMFARRAPTAALTLLLICAVVFCLFWAGARLGGRPHTVKSLVLAILVTWSFSFSTYGLSKQLFANVAYANRLVELLQFVLVFLMAWRSAPKVPTSAVADGGDAAA
jgi:uncharacterized protein (DUF486 family)